MENFVQLKDVSKIYQMGEVKIVASNHLNFSISKENSLSSSVLPAPEKPLCLTYWAEWIM